LTPPWEIIRRASLVDRPNDVAMIEPLLVTYNAKGEVEGVKYDRVGVVLINAIKEQQAQIESLEQQVTALKVLVCSKRSKAAVCKK